MEWIGVDRVCGLFVAAAHILVKMSRLIAKEEPKVPVVA